MTLKKRRFLLAAQLLCSAAVVVLAVLQLIGRGKRRSMRRNRCLVLFCCLTALLTGIERGLQLRRPL